MSVNFIKAALIATIAVSGVALSTQAGATYSSDSCLDAKDTDSYVTSLTRGTGTISTRNGKPLCKDAEIALQSFKLPSTWDGNGWNRTAIPQTKHAAIVFTIPSGQANYKKTISIDVPEACYATQLDFYFTPVVEAIVNYHDGEDREIYGKIFKATGACEEPKTIKVCELSTKKIVTINEKDFNSNKYSKNLDDCKVKPVTPPVTPEPPVVTPPAVTPPTVKPPVVTPPAVAVELPQTGIAGVVSSAIGLGSLVVATYYYIASRRKTV